MMDRPCVSMLLLSMLLSCIQAMNIEIIGGIERASQYAMNDLELAYQLVDPSIIITNKLMQEADMFEQLTKNKIDFGTTVSSIPYEMYSTTPTLRLVPLVLTGLAPIYNLKSIGNADLVIPREALAMIFAGQITRWNDPSIQWENSFTLPDQPITVVLEHGSNPMYKIMKTAFRKFYRDRSVLNITSNDDWPYARYADYKRVPASTTMLVSTVIANDGTIAMTYHAIAVLLGAKIAQMTNQVGRIVSITPDSLSLAAMELGTGFGEMTHEILDLTDAANPSAWPIPTFVYLVFDTDKSRATCRGRQALIQYFFYFYASPVVKAMINDRRYASVPLVLFERLGINDMANKIRCRGELVLSQAQAPGRVIGTSKQNFMKARLAGAVYIGVNATYQFRPQITTDNLLAAQLLTSEIDVGLINPAYVSQNLWSQLSDEFIILPLYAQAISHFVNPMLRATPYVSLSSSVTEAITPAPFVLSPQILFQIVTACNVTHFDHPQILALNEWMRPLLGNQSIPFTYLSACGDSETRQFSSDSFMASKNIAMSYNNPVVMGCLNPEINPSLAVIEAGFESCQPTAGMNVQWVPDASSTPAVATGTPGGLASSIMDGDRTKLMINIARTRNNVTTIIAPDRDSVWACASTSYDSATMSFDFDKSTHPNCWPYTQVNALMVRKRYWSDSTVTNSSACSRGIDSLRFAKWLLTTNDLNSVTNAEHSIRLITADPRVRRDYIAALEAAVCDHDTLLITLPVVWELSSTFKGFGIALAAIGLAWSALHIAFVVYYHNHAVIRSASVLLVLITLVGVQMMFASVISLLQPASTQTCSAIAWLFDVGLLLAVAPLFVKVYRVYRISSGRQLKAVRMTNRQLLLMVSGMLALELAFMAAWQAISPLQPITTSVMKGPREYLYTECSTDGSGYDFLIATTLIKGAVILGAALMAFSTRKQASSQFNESVQMSYALYNFVLTIGVLGVIYGVISPRGDVATVLLFLIAILLSFVTCSLLVVPKMIVIWIGKDEATKTLDSSPNMSSTGFSFLSLDVFSSLPTLGGYIAALRRHLDTVESRQAVMQRSQGVISPSALLSPSQSTMNRRQIDSKQINSGQLRQPTRSSLAD